MVANRAAMKALHYDNLSEALVQEENERRLNPNAPLHPIVAVVEDYYDRHLSAGHRPIISNAVSYTHLRFSIAVSNLACMGRERLPISSRKSVPPVATSIRPAFAFRASVKAPFS